MVISNFEKSSFQFYKHIDILRVRSSILIWSTSHNNIHKILRGLRSWLQLMGCTSLNDTHSLKNQMTLTHSLCTQSLRGEVSVMKGWASEGWGVGDEGLSVWGVRCRCWRVERLRGEVSVLKCWASEGLGVCAEGLSVWGVRWLCRRVDRVALDYIVSILISVLRLLLTSQISYCVAVWKQLRVNKWCASAVICVWCRSVSWGSTAQNGFCVLSSGSSTIGRKGVIKYVCVQV